MSDVVPADPDADLRWMRGVIDLIAHAEMVAIGTACATLYSMLEPCVLCAGAIDHCP